MVGHNGCTTKSYLNCGDKSYIDAPFYNFPLCYLQVWHKFTTKERLWAYYAVSCKFSFYKTILSMRHSPLRHEP